MARKKRKNLSMAAIKKQVASAIKASKGSKRRSKKPRKKALLIGINEYKNGSNLRGCINDIDNVESVLRKYFGFTSASIKRIADRRATTARMRTEIVKLVAGAAKGDVLYLHYSGHGAWVPDKNGDEKDNQDEILCPTDLNWNDPLLDDWIRAVFDTVPKGVNLTVVFDSCHSGSATRKLVNPHSKSIPRYLPNPWEFLHVETGSRSSGKSRGRLSKARKRAGRGNVTTIRMPDVMISGCKDNQTSADAYIRGSYNGALTYNLMAAIKRKRGKLTVRQAHADALKRVRKGGYRQTPQVSGTKDNLSHGFLQPYA